MDEYVDRVFAFGRKFSSFRGTSVVGDVVTVLMHERDDEAEAAMRRQFPGILVDRVVEGENVETKDGEKLMLEFGTTTRIGSIRATGKGSVICTKS